MPNNSVAEGSLVLTLDATRLNQGMQRQAQKSKADGAKLGKEVSGGAREQIGSIFGGESVGAGLLKGGAIGAGVAAVGFAAKQLYELAQNNRAFHRSLEEGEDRWKRWGYSVEVAIDRAKQRLAEFEAVAGTKTGQEARGRELDYQQLRFQQIGDDVAKARKDAEELDSMWNTWNSFSHWVGGVREEKHTSLVKNLDVAKQGLEAQRRAVDELKREQKDLQNPLTSPAAMKALREFVHETELATKAILEERSAEDIAIDKMQARFGFKENDVRLARHLVRLKELAQVAKDAKEFTDELTKELDAQLRGEQRTSEEQKLDEFLKRGIDQEQAARIRDLIELKKRLNEQYKPLTGLQRGTKEEQAFQNEAAFLRERAEAGKGELELLKKQLAELQKIAKGIAGIRAEKVPEM